MKESIILIAIFVLTIIFSICCSIKRNNSIVKIDETVNTVKINNMGTRALIDGQITRLVKTDLITNMEIIKLKNQIIELNNIKCEEIQRLQTNINALQRQIDELRVKINKEPSIIEKRIYVYPDSHHRPGCN